MFPEKVPEGVATLIELPFCVMVIE